MAHDWLGVLSRRKYLVLAVIVLAVAGLVCVFVFGREREPEYGGERLSWWVMQWYFHYKGDEAIYGDRKSADPNLELTDEANSAIRHIGPKALPCLLNWIRYEVPQWKVKLEKATTGWPKIAMVLRYLGVGVRDEKALRARYAVAAFRALGPQAIESIPELTRILNKTKGGPSAVRATYALGFVGESALPPLLAALTNQGSQELQGLILVRIGSMGTNAGPAVPALLKWLQHPDWEVRRNATNALKKIDPRALERARLE